MLIGEIVLIRNSKKFMVKGFKLRGLHCKNVHVGLEILEIENLEMQCTCDYFVNFIVCTACDSRFSDAIYT